MNSKNRDFKSCLSGTSYPFTTFPLPFYHLPTTLLPPSHYPFTTFPLPFYHLPITLSPHTHYPIITFPLPIHHIPTPPSTPTLLHTLFTFPHCRVRGLMRCLMRCLMMCRLMRCLMMCPNSVLTICQKNHEMVVTRGKLYKMCLQIS